MLELTIENGVCQYSMFSFASYAVVIVCYQSKDVAIVREAIRIGKAGLALMKRFPSPVILSEVIFNYYGMVAIWYEALEVCSKQLKRGFEGKSRLKSINFITILC